MIQRYTHLGAKKGDWIALRTLDNTSCAAPTEIEFSFLVSPKTVGLLHLSRLSTHFGGDWVSSCDFIGSRMLLLMYIYGMKD